MGLIGPPIQGLSCLGRVTQGGALGWIMAAPLGLRIAARVRSGTGRDVLPCFRPNGAILFLERGQGVCSRLLQACGSPKQRKYSGEIALKEGEPGGVNSPTDVGTGKAKLNSFGSAARRFAIHERTVVIRPKPT